MIEFPVNEEHSGANPISINYIVYICKLPPYDLTCVIFPCKCIQINVRTYINITQ